MATMNKTMAEGSEKIEGITRRTLCAGACAGAVALAVGGLKVMPSQALVRPPGGQDEDRMLERCIRCALCIESCPWRVLRGARLSESIIGVGMPVADFTYNWCDLCVSRGGTPLCTQICPTGALELPEDGSTPVIGIAEIVQEWCLPWATGKKCKRCYRICPSEHRAIKLDKKGRPTVDVEKCVGCGACQKACLRPDEGSLAPQPDLRAIMVKPFSAL